MKYSGTVVNIVTTGLCDSLDAFKYQKIQIEKVTYYYFCDSRNIIET